MRCGAARGAVRGVWARRQATERPEKAAHPPRELAFTANCSNKFAVEQINKHGANKGANPPISKEDERHTFFWAGGAAAAGNIQSVTSLR